ncbi:MAG: signal transduction histidine kinase, partial [Kiritimatiellia bacterium]
MSSRRASRDRSCHKTHRLQSSRGEIVKRRTTAYIALTRAGDVRACAPEASVLLGAQSPDHVVNRSLADFVRDDAWPRLERTLRDEPSGLSELWMPTLHGRVLQIRVLDRSKNLYEIWDDTPRALLVDASRQAEQEQARASLAGSVARELNDPMAIVQGRLELLIEMGAADPERIVRHLKVALGHARRVSSTLHLLRLVGRPAVDDRGVITVRELVQFAIDEAGSHVGPDNIEIDVVPSDMVLAGSTDLLAQVVAHLFGRLDDLCARGGRAWVQARQLDGKIVVQLWALPRGSGVVDPSRGEPAQADPRLDVGVVDP